MSERLRAGWAVMGRPERGSLTSYGLDMEVGGRSVRLAVDHYGRRHLLVPCPDENLALDARPSVLGTRVRSLEFAGDVCPYVDVTCEDADLTDQFDDVLDDVLEDLAQASGAPGRTAVSSIGRWRRLFARAGLDRLSPRAARGLFAELWLLRELQRSCTSTTPHWWTGADRHPHDFELPHGCIEVKAFGEDQQSVHIHGIRQLARHEDRPLHMLLVQLADDPEGASLTDLVDHLLRTLPDRATLRRKLQLSGWREGGDPGNSFLVRRTIRVPVAQDVPRLVPESLTAGDLPKGVEALEYSLSVDAVTPHAAGEPLATVLEDLCR